jgi:hypothetical protein
MFLLFLSYNTPMVIACFSHFKPGAFEKAKTFTINYSHDKLYQMNEQYKTDDICVRELFIHVELEDLFRVFNDSIEYATIRIFE